LSTVVTALLLDSIVYPFILSAAATAAAIAVARRTARQLDLLPLAMVPGVAAGMVSLLGWPDLPPRGALDKLTLLLPILAVPSAWLARRRHKTSGTERDAAGENQQVDRLVSHPPESDRRHHTWPTALLFAAATAWVAQPVLPWQDPLAPLLVLLALFAGLCAARYAAGKGASAATPLAIALFWYAVGLAGTVFYGASSAMALIAGSMAAALAGMMAATWPRRQVGSTVLLTTWQGGMLIAFTAMVWLYTASPPLSLAILLLVFITLPYLDRMPAAFRRPRVAPWIQTGLSALPVLAAIAWARFDQGPPVY